MVEEHERQISCVRILLRHLLELRAPEGHPLLCAELLIQQIMEDCEGRYGWSGKGDTSADIIAFAYGRGSLSFSSSDMSVFFGTMELLYRRLVCYIGRPDWLCGPLGPQLVHPDFPVYLEDRKTRTSYAFVIKRIEPDPRDPGMRRRK